jgi:VIT1/CCC1 family predicted Fe2+/Mn2+ transporter
VPVSHRESHNAHRTVWLRAAVLGANDGVISTASLILGVASAGASRHSILVAGFAGLASGAMAMAAGEYVSVHAQADTEAADLKREKAELLADPEGELKELTQIYIARGLDASLAAAVAAQLTRHDANAAHARDELGITDMQAARPLKAALASASSFLVGAAIPLSIAGATPTNGTIASTCAASLLALATLGVAAGHAGGANMRISVLRVTFWGALAMAVTTAVGFAFGAPIR